MTAGARGTNPALIQRVVLRNYRSIRACNVELSPLTVVVGRNGAGKSNFVDALRFVRDALTGQLDSALRDRGGIGELLCRSGEVVSDELAVEFRLGFPDGGATYGFSVRSGSERGYEVFRERCFASTKSHGSADFSVENGETVRFTYADSPRNQFLVGPGLLLAAPTDRLSLGTVSNLRPFRPVYDALTQMVFQNLSPEVMRRPQKPEPGKVLLADGRNIASVVKELSTTGANIKSRILDYLCAIGVDIQDFQTISVGGYETLKFSQRLPGGTRGLVFDASSMSDGTLRAFGILVSLLGAPKPENGGPTLVAVEEPETALHPAATGALFDAISEASTHTQVLVTCHSPELIDRDDLPPESILAVMLDDKGTRLGKLSQAKRELMSHHLQTAGELLRMDQLVPDPRGLASEDFAPTLFEDSP